MHDRDLTNRRNLVSPSRKSKMINLTVGLISLGIYARKPKDLIYGLPNFGGSSSMHSFPDSYPETESYKVLVLQVQETISLPSRVLDQN